MAQEAAAPLLLDWSQGEKSGTVTVDHGTKASGLQACLNAEGIAQGGNQRSLQAPRC
jgi:hypothetical protein